MKHLASKLQHAYEAATRRLVCTCECDDATCDREWWAPADTEGKRIEFDCDRMVLRAEPDGTVVCLGRRELVAADEAQAEPDPTDLATL